MAIALGNGKNILSMTLIDLSSGKETHLFERSESRCHFLEDINYQQYIITLRIDWGDIRDTDPVLDADIFQNNNGKKGKRLKNGKWHHTLKQFDEQSNKKIYEFSFRDLKLRLSAQMTFSLAVGMDGIIIDLHQELLKAAHHHLKKALIYEVDSNPFPLWREIRSAVLLALTAIEAFMTKEASAYIERFAIQDQIIFDYFQEKEQYVDQGKDRKGFRPMSLDKKILEWTKIFTGRDFDKTDSAWQTFLEVKAFRDALTQYPPKYEDLYKNTNITMAKNAIFSVKAIMLHYYDYSGRPAPPWLNTIDIDNF